MELEEARIENIGPDLESRGGIQALLPGLQHLYSDKAFRGRLFPLLEEHMIPSVNRTTRRDHGRGPATTEPDGQRPGETGADAAVRGERREGLIGK